MVRAVVHDGITCDMCKRSPIQGPRYQCTVCKDYDMCWQCEALNKHDPTHALLKMVVPKAPPPAPVMKGLPQAQIRPARPYNHVPEMGMR